MATTVINQTVKVTVPPDWTDEQVQHLLPYVESAMNLGLKAISDRLRVINSEVTLEWSPS